MSEHTSKQYDAELESVRAKVLQMGGLVEQQIVNALGALVELDAKKAASVIDLDHQVNALEVQVDEDCSHIIARRQPAAGDLRMIMMVVKTITDLERIGDEATKIARAARAMHQRGLTPIAHEEIVRVMAVTASEMLHGALDSFARLDEKQATRLIVRD